MGKFGEKNEPKLWGKSKNTKTTIIPPKINQIPQKILKNPPKIGFYYVSQWFLTEENHFRPLNHLNISVLAEVTENRPKMVKNPPKMVKNPPKCVSNMCHLNSWLRRTISGLWMTSISQFWAKLWPPPGQKPPKPKMGPKRGKMVGSSWIPIFFGLFIP